MHERLSLLGKAGLFLAETEVSEIADGNAFSDDFKNWDPSLGIGVRFELRPGLGLRAEWERFELDPGSATLLSVGVDLRF